MKTIKQLADELSVSKTAIRKRLTPEFRENYVEITANGVLTINENGCKLIAETLQTYANPIPETNENTVSGADKDIIEFFKKQLEEKDKQIAALQTALNKAHQIADQAQQLEAKKVLELEAPKGFRKWFGWKKGV